jgi:hypothetical protein
MQVKADILFGVSGQSLFYDCPQGRPSSVTDVQVFEDLAADTGTEESALTGSSSIDSVSTTTDAAAGASQADPTKIPLTATTSVEVGRVYLLTNVLGQEEWPEVERIESGVAVWARNPLHADHASGATFVSTRISVTVDTTWASDASRAANPLAVVPRYRVVWTYVVGGKTYRGISFFDLVRNPFVCTVKPIDVDRLSRGWLNRLASEDRLDQGEHVIDEATLQVKLDLQERGLAAYAQRSSDAVNELIRRKAVQLVHEQARLHGGVEQALLDYSTKQYWDRVDALVPKSSQQVTPEGSGGTAPLAPLYRR